MSLYMFLNLLFHIHHTNYHYNLFYTRLYNFACLFQYFHSLYLIVLLYRFFLALLPKHIYRLLLRF